MGGADWACEHISNIEASPCCCEVWDFQTEQKVVACCFHKRVTQFAATAMPQWAPDLWRSRCTASRVSAVRFKGSKDAICKRLAQLICGSHRSMRTAPSQATLLSIILPTSSSRICRSSTSRPWNATCRESKNFHQRLITLLKRVRKSCDRWSISFSPRINTWGCSWNKKLRKPSRGESSCLNRLVAWWLVCGGAKIMPESLSSSMIRCRRNWAQIART